MVREPGRARVPSAPVRVPAKASNEENDDESGESSSYAILMFAHLNINSIRLL